MRKKLVLGIAVTIGLAVVASLIILLSVAPAASALGVNMANVWALAKNIGLTVGVGGAIIIFLAFAFNINRPDSDVPPG